MNNKVKLTEEEIYNGGICQCCFIKFNEFDEHATLASKIQNEITEIYESCASLEYMVKLEDENDVKDDQLDISEVIIENSLDCNEISEYEQDDQYDAIADTSDSKVKRQYRRKKNLDEGLIVVEVDGVKIYQCEICQKLCKDRYKLKAHREIHTTERRICCNECGAMFKTLTCLYSHKKIHRERIYYYCDLCDMRYIQKTQLRKHIFAIHLKRKDYVCEYNTKMCKQSIHFCSQLTQVQFVENVTVGIQHYRSTCLFIIQREM